MKNDPYSLLKNLDGLESIGYVVRNFILKTFKTMWFRTVLWWEIKRKTKCAIQHNRTQIFHAIGTQLIVLHIRILHSLLEYNDKQQRASRCF